MTKPGPGKFEGCESLEVANALYEIGLAGDAEDDFAPARDTGYYSLILVTEDDDPDLTAPAYVTVEQENGAFTYTAYESHGAARQAWNKMVEEDAEHGMVSELENRSHT